MLAREYFGLSDCPSVLKVSEADIAGMSLHIIGAGVDLDGRRILSVGCGDGRIDAELLRHFTPSRVVLSDFSGKFLEDAGKRIPGAELFLSDAESLPDGLSGEFDVIYSVNMAQYLTAPQIMKMNISLSKSLSEGGKIYHFGIPDSRRRFLFRINNAIVMKNAKYLLPRCDFIDSFSFWHRRNTFRAEGFTSHFLTPSFRWERFDAVLEKKSQSL